MTTFFCRNEHEEKLWPSPSCHTHPQWYDKLWNLMLYAIHKIRAYHLFHRHAYVSKMPCVIAKLGAHFSYDMHASGWKPNRSYYLYSIKKISMPLVQVACLHSDFILLVDGTVWSWEADPTHEGLALHVYIEIKCMDNCFICVEA